MTLNIQEIIDYINKKIDNNEHINVRTCCNHFNYSYYYFSRYFKKMFGVTLSRYLTAAKIEKSAELLLHADSTVQDAHMKVQYQSSSSYTHTFKTIMGETPKKYQQNANELMALMSTLFDINYPIDLDLNTFRPSSNNKSSLSYTDIFVNIELPSEAKKSIIVIGLYEESLALGMPLKAKALFAQTRCTFVSVPPGSYYVFASIIEIDSNPRNYFFPRKLMKACNRTPLDILPAKTVDKIDSSITIFEEEIDLPVAINIPKLLLDSIKDKKNGIIQ